MARNLCVMKVLPEDTEVDLKALQGEIENKLQKDIKDVDGNHQLCQLMKCVEEPIAFGLKALKIHVAIPENMPGGTTPVEEALAEIPGIQRVETEIVTRL
ncbi:elongation factor 1-beta [Candidatus Bathyarchaeota archaeon]|nr:elongation factor 1-beta [Candidatus Bathyarchaeota archaeon]